jgi:hypothetical protein
MNNPIPAQGVEPSCLTLYPLTFVAEGDQVIIGRPEVDSFAVFSPDAAAVVRRIEAGETLASVADWYQTAYGEPADLGDFVETLRDLDFIRPEGEAGAQYQVRPSVRWRQLANVVFSAPAMCLYILVVGMAVYLMWRVPALRPAPSKVFFSRSLLVVMGLTTVGQLVGIAVHEGFHVLAGRRLGLASRLSVGRRLYFLVFQTTLVGLLGVPARKRILPFCAGLIADALSASALTGIAEVGRLAGWPPWPGRVAIGLAYLTLLRMLWQAMIFMETDLCHVLASALACPDLHSMTRSYLRSRWAARGRRPDLVADTSGWTNRDLRIVRGYAPFVIVGSIAIIGLGAITTVPVVLKLAARIYHGIAGGALSNPWFWDSVIAGVAIVSPFAVVAMLALRDRTRRLTTVRAGMRPGS